ncbi:diketogulonate reductase-like aldo/keto reductase [Sphingobacterium allocomposti]|uniref:Diketogulonate reductase-like aldo/keto reductase n=1 Tax=Sphingobacterium allocomposti TaxID=415956 RepID=A0A5S5DMI0_9SPHI|nr:aldo/keto reductase [Sphingobacterium composti Yoo et al. 2007 non Ten et al. 2007]TYP97143.1 diketogulonate reductase-like aldo/keto reductase [Sphingobacterium composti Yoo et al. 2007 non Ten et al. 2007]HLS93985.1 aldo/keto reductase [Sphingobacterium sp.]
MQYITLNDGNKIPLLGLGTYKATEEIGVESVQAALASGYRLIDTAAKYQNEEQVGRAIRQSGVPREEIVVTTKLWRENLGYEEAKEAFAESLRKLDLRYIDLYLIHWPANAKNYADWERANADAWLAMEELQAEGKVRSIGVSNFWPEHLEALSRTARVMPAVNQIEFHPGYWQPEVVEFCRQRGITVQAWSPLARGKVFGNEVLEDIANKHRKTVSQVCLRWVIQHGVVVIPKSASLSRIRENLDIFDFELTDAEMEQINTLPQMGFSGELPHMWPDRVTDK